VLGAFRYHSFSTKSLPCIQHHTLFHAIAVQTGNIAFFGTSSVRRWPISNLTSAGRFLTESHLGSSSFFCTTGRAELGYNSNDPRSGHQSRSLLPHNDTTVQQGHIRLDVVQVMTVSSLIHFFESVDQQAQFIHTACSGSATSHDPFYESPSRSRLTSSHKMKLSLHTIFTPQDRSLRSRGRQPLPAVASTTTSPSISMDSAPVPTPAYPSLARPQTPTRNHATTGNGTYLSPASSATSSSPPSSLHTPSSQYRYPQRKGRYLRRRPSSRDLALDAERSAAELLGLGLLEPRPRAVSATSLAGSLSGESECSFVDWREAEAVSAVGMGVGREVVLDGIFEVLERGR
jgi:hypothetical protein